MGPQFGKAVLAVDNPVDIGLDEAGFSLKHRGREAQEDWGGIRAEPLGSPSITSSELCLGKLPNLGSDRQN
jgi:hypothetical protein